MTKKEIKSRIKLWKYVLGVIELRIERDYFIGSGICHFIASYIRTHINELPDPFLSLHLYPEFWKYKPKKMYYMDTRYWWSPHSKSGFVKRREVVKNIISDLEKQLK